MPVSVEVHKIQYQHHCRINWKHCHTTQGTRTAPTLSRQPVPKGWSISTSFYPIVCIPSRAFELRNDSSSASNYVEIEHDAHYKTHYFHLNHLLVKEGQRVKRGQRIGLSGHSGLSSGPHLHYELLKDGNPVDAMRTIALSSTALPNAELTLFKMNYQNKVKWPSTFLP